jgi:nucleoside-diphosphate-sugar epimerase
VTGSDLHVVLGASGGIGRALVHELARRGHPVRAVHRRAGAVDLPRGVAALAADVSTAEGARAACAGAAVVHHCVQPPYHRWAEEFPALNEAVLAGAAAAGAKLVVADNLYPYAPPVGGPLTEDAPQRPTSRKGAVRLALATRLLDAHRAGTVRVAIGRASDYYGPGATVSAAGERVFGAVLAGRTVRWPGRVDVPRTLHHVDDIARGLATLAEDDRADGRAWILPAAAPLTPRELVQRIGAAAGRPARIAGTPRAVLRLLGLVDRGAGELPDIWYQFDRPWTADDGQFQRAFGPQPATAYDEGIAATVEWYRRRAARAATRPRAGCAASGSRPR